MKTKFIVPALFVILLAFVLYYSLPFFNASQGKVEWVSPYRDTDWNGVIRAKAQFHTHTTRSDGHLNPQVLVDRYHELGYDVLAITDHWRVTYPWQEFTSFEPSAQSLKRFEAGELNVPEGEDFSVFENRDPAALGMIAVKASEPSHTGPRRHHIVSLFSEVTGQGMEFEETVKAIGKDGGLISFAHPARSTEKGNNTTEDYVYFLGTYPHIYGIDIFTRATFRDTGRWPYSLELYSGILNHFGSPSDPGWRPVWMTCTDDLHSLDDLDQALQIQLVSELTHEQIYKSLEDGAFFWVAKAVDAEVPRIESVEFGKSSITVRGKGFDQVSWYYDGKVIHTGNTFDLYRHGTEDQFYVYFMAHTSDFSLEKKTGALLGSQPFWTAERR